MNLFFASKTPKQSRAALEELLFFNPRQFRVRDGILDSLKKFGHPRVVETSDGLSVRVGEHEAQALFAFNRDRAGEDPVGIVIFLRTSPSQVDIVHVAVHPEYGLKGRYAGVGLGIGLVEKVKQIAAQIVGVERIVFFYRQEVVIRL